METNTSVFEPLLERVEQYSKGKFELLKLKSVDKTADLSATFISRLLLTVTLILFSLTLNIAVALWIGDLLKKSYYGFLIVAGFYFLIGILLYLLHPSIKTKIQNSIIKHMLK